MRYFIPITSLDIEELIKIFIPDSPKLQLKVIYCIYSLGPIGYLGYIKTLNLLN